VLLTAGIVERRLVRPPSAAIWWALFLVWATLSVAWAIDSELALESLKRLLSMGLLYLVAVSMQPSRKEFHWVCVLAAAGGMVAVSINYLFGADVEAVRRGLVVGDKTTNPNGFGTVLALPAALAMAGVVGQRRLIGRLVALGTLGFLGTGIYLTISRGAILALLVVILVFIYRIGVRWQVVVLVALLASLVATMPDAFFVRMSTVFTGQDTTGSGRTEIWKTGVAALDRFGVFGAGYGNYTAIYRFSDAEIYGRRQGAHNSYLEIWIELGIVGLVLMLAAVAGHFLAARGLRRVSQEGVVLSAIEAACFGMLAGAFFGDDISVKSFWLRWILLTWASGVAWRGQVRRSGP
jgi:O-antigen ligase